MQIVYLSPDAAAPLQSLDARCVYVLGGLVDEQLKRGHTATAAAQARRWRCICVRDAWQAGIATARLPIAEYMTQAPGSSYAPVLSINQARALRHVRAQCTAGVCHPGGVSLHAGLDAGAGRGRAAPQGISGKTACCARVMARQPTLTTVSEPKLLAAAERGAETCLVG